VAVTGIAGLALDVGAHWPTDVIGRYLLGAAWALLLWPLMRRA
jgi:membrane-associated phospholipid phosphatase